MKLVSSTLLFFLALTASAFAQAAPTPQPTALGSTVQPSQVIPVSTPGATFGGTIPFTFPTQVTAPSFVGSVNASTASNAFTGAVAQSLSALFGESLHSADFGAVCDGLTNTTAALQEGITASAGHARFYIDSCPFSYVIVNGLNFPSNSQVVIDGTIMNEANSPNAPYILGITGANNVRIEGNGTLDGNNVNVPLCGVCAGISITTASNIYISGLTIQNVHNWPINTGAATNIYLSYIHAINNGNALECNNTSVCWMDHLNVSGTTDACVAFYGGVSYGYLTNSRLTSCLQGVAALSDSGQPAPNNHILIADNIISSSTSSVNGYGVSLTNSAGTTTGSGSSSDYLVTGNITNNNTGAGYGIIAYTGSPIKNIKITANTSEFDGTTGNAGIIIGGVTSNVISNVAVTDNTIFNTGPGTVLGFGIYILSPYTYPDVVISNNTIYDNQTTHSMKYGIFGAEGPSNEITYNHLLGPFITSALNLTPASDTIVVAYTNGNFTINQPVVLGSTISATNFPYLATNGTYTSGPATASAGTLHTEIFTNVTVTATPTTLTFSTGYNGHSPSCTKGEHAATPTILSVPTTNSVQISTASGTSSADVTCVGYQ